MVTTPARSALMARVRQVGTTPELVVRSIVEGLGHPFATNGRELPGSPDLYDSDRKLAVLVHGCFWHRHAPCAASTCPKTNRRFWETKFAQNKTRDRRNARKLRRLGFRVLTVWGCQVRTPAKLTRLKRRIDNFFNSEGQWPEL
jgi:DNA mismatch endonuclease (patch repair protein)